MSLSTIELSTHESVGEIGESEWSALVSETTPPFLKWSFLDVLEKTGSVTPDRGWLPCHIALRRGGVLAAVAPAYLKGNSEGEFVFDHGWASFAEGRLGIRYYPKLIVAVPFTPATGPRLLVRPGEDERELVSALARALPELAKRLTVSSAHVLFPCERQADAFESSGMAHRFGLQFHWQNQGYASFDDYLSRFNSKRRHQIKREMRAPAEQGVEIETLSGGELDPELIDSVFDFYLSTVNKYYWGRQYLNRAFFEELCARQPNDVMVVLARDTSSRRPIAGAFNLVGGGALYGRYWGATEERPFLHFNVCYYRGIVECIARKLSLFEPGAGGEHKLVRGFEPTVTHSVHHLVDRRLDAAVRDFVEREKERVVEHVDDYRREPVVRRG
ncbi:MAG TPA: GNAT family N-acetyltransferase [Polyangiaceae bacterium]|nr:GNAT family N-acetyltransferase [Polyangiaceae bacterium]